MKTNRRSRADAIIFPLVILALAGTGTYLGIQAWETGEAVRACENAGSIVKVETMMEHGDFKLVSCTPPSTTIIVLPDNIGPAVTSPRDAPR